MYGRMQNESVTMIDQLPELEDLEGVGEGGRGSERYMDDKYQKHIRGNHRAVPQSGMMPVEGYNSITMQQPMQQRYQRQGDEGDYPNPSQGIPPNYKPPFPHDPMGISCLDIAKHVESCPICSRFYNNDKTIYIILIILLSVLCLLLIKKVLDI